MSGKGSNVNGHVILAMVNRQRLGDLRSNQRKSETVKFEKRITTRRYEIESVGMHLIVLSSLLKKLNDYGYRRACKTLCMVIRMQYSRQRNMPIRWIRFLTECYTKVPATGSSELGKDYCYGWV